MSARSYLGAASIVQMTMRGNITHPAVLGTTNFGVGISTDNVTHTLPTCVSVACIDGSAPTLLRACTLTPARSLVSER
eukprot:5085557-Pleurochrysis_carterae.AAC.1